MSVRWKTITDRLHKESGLRDTTNEVGTILDSTVGESLDRYDEYLDTATLQGFLLTSSGDYLDEHGLEYGGFYTIKSILKTNDVINKWGERTLFLYY